MLAPMTGVDVLQGRAEELLGRHRRWVLAWAGPSGDHAITHGLPDHADVEIGSVSKGLTGLLYTDALARGEIGSSATVGDVLDRVPAPLAPLRLGDLATHTAGLPRLWPAPFLRRTWQLWRTGANPYREDLADMLEACRDVKVRAPGRPAYSNLGFCLLGHAVAAAAGTTYDELLAERLAVPVGLSGTYVPYRPEDLRPAAVVGSSRWGRSRAPWAAESVAPAGGVRTTAADLRRLLRALLEESAPGVGALDPVRGFTGRTRIGAGWITISPRGRPLVWHNGMTGGHSACVALDRTSGVGVALASATARSVDPAAFRLLAELSDGTAQTAE